MDWLGFAVGCAVFAVVWHVVQEVFFGTRELLAAYYRRKIARRLLEQVEAMQQQEASTGKSLCRSCNKNERMMGSFLCMPCAKGD